MASATETRKLVGALVVSVVMAAGAATSLAGPNRHHNPPQRHGNSDFSVAPPATIDPIDPVGMDFADVVVRGPDPAPVFAPPDDDSSGGLPPLVGPDGLAGVGTYTAAGGSRGTLAGHRRPGPVVGTYGPLPGGGYGGTPVPEPTSALLLLAGGLALASGRRRHC